MNRLLYGIAVVTLVTSTFVLWCACVVYAAATPPAVYTNENFWDSYHDAPLSFSGDSQHGFTGYTVSGKYFEQMPVVNDLRIKLHRFSIDEAWYYISDRGIIVAKNDLHALSIYMSRIG